MTILYDSYSVSPATAAVALAIDPQDAGVRYNVACLYALEGRIEEAFTRLAEVVKVGFGSPAWFRRDPDLAALRGDPRFDRLMADAGAGPAT